MTSNNTSSRNLTLNIYVHVKMLHQICSHRWAEHFRLQRRLFSVTIFRYAASFISFPASQTIVKGLFGNKGQVTCRLFNVYFNHKTDFCGVRVFPHPGVGNSICFGGHFEKVAFCGGPNLLMKIKASLGSSLSQH